MKRQNISKRISNTLLEGVESFAENRDASISNINTKGHSWRLIIDSGPGNEGEWECAKCGRKVREPRVLERFMIGHRGPFVGSVVDGEPLKDCDMYTVKDVMVS